MRTDVRERIGERVENFWLDTFINSKLNEGRRRFCNEEDWEWMFTTQSGITVPQGSSTIELIDDVAVNRHFSLVLTKSGDDDLYLPEKVSPGKGVQLRAKYTTASTPRWWYTTGNITNDYGGGDIAVAQIVRLVPTPEVQYTAEYNFIRNPGKLSLDTDEDRDIPEAYQDAAIAWAAAQCFMKELNAPAKADEQLGLYADVLRQARAHHLGNAVDELTVWGKDAPEDYGTVSQWPPRMPRIN